MDGCVELRVGRIVQAGNAVAITDSYLPVSRAGLKLNLAFDKFPLPALAGQVVLDLGAATGGFTQILLQQGAAVVVAIDVGTNQLAQELRLDSRVISLENTDARSITREGVSEVVAQRLAAEPAISTPLGNLNPALISVDVSFISLGHLIPMLRANFADAQVLALFKPQFEVGRHGLGKNGVVKSEALIKQAIESFVGEIELNGGSLLGAVESPILGQSGNREFLLWITMQTDTNRRELLPKPADWLDDLLRGSTVLVD